MTLSFKKWFKRVFWSVFIVGVLFWGLNLQYENGRYAEELTWNHFLQEDGLFAFDYRHDYEVRENEGIYYVQEISKENVVFQIFEESEERFFEEWDYDCEQGVCYSESEAVMNLELLPGPAADRFDMLTRAETLEWLLTLRYPDKDFSQYAADCFEDVTAADPLSEYVCYAQDQGIVVGIGGSFYSDSSINLWGVLKILFLVFEEDDYEFDESELDESMFELMTKYHYAYDLVGKAYYEGLFANVTGKDIWPNRAVYKAEASMIAENFFAWQDGKILRDYEGDDDYEEAGLVYVRDLKRDFEFVELPVEEFVVDIERDVEAMQNSDGVSLHVVEDGRIYEFLVNFEGMARNDIDDVQLSYDEERLIADVLFEYEDGEEAYYQLQVADDEFSYLTEGAVSTVDDPNVLPNEVDYLPSAGVIPKIEMFMSEESFEEVLEDRTVTTRYPTYVVITDENGGKEEFSAMIKTRGNANRGYIKSSYTVEAFGSADEFKLRSLISDESMMREKIIYYLFGELGYLTPEFSEVMLEINGVPFGFYQMTEAIKDKFFEDRGLFGDYFYARNVTSPYPANLMYFEDEDITLTHYKVDGGAEAEEKLLQFIYRIEIGDESLLEEIDLQNIFDYAFLVYALNVQDSLMHNYYLYLEDEVWKLFLWDGDEGFVEIPEISKEGFREFTARTDGLWNELILFVFDGMSGEDFEVYWGDLMSRWLEVDLVGKLDDYLAKYGEFYEWDNAIWNERYLERKEHVFDSLGAIADLREKLLDVEGQMGSF
jgi:hypothetical protein